VQAVVRRIRVARVGVFMGVVFRGDGDWGYISFCC